MLNYQCVNGLGFNTFTSSAAHFQSLALGFRKLAGLNRGTIKMRKRIFQSVGTSQYSHTIYIYIYEPPSKSIVYAWYKNISYRSLGGPYRFPVFCSNQHEILQKCKGISFTDSDLNCRGWIKGLSLSLRLQPCWGAI